MKKTIGLSLILLTMSSCGELSYKQGATAQDLEAAKKTCKNSGNEAQMTACLEKNGWVVKPLNDLDLFATASASPDNHDPNIKEAPNAKENSSSEKSAIVTSDNTPAVTTPLDLYTISSWWKMGAGREPLETDINTCVKTLGEAHQPNKQTQQVTRGLVICMHEKGWKALKAN